MRVVVKDNIQTAKIECIRSYYEEFGYCEIKTEVIKTTKDYITIAVNGIIYLYER